MRPAHVRSATTPSQLPATPSRTRYKSHCCKIGRPPPRSPARQPQLGNSIRGSSQGAHLQLSHSTRLDGAKRALQAQAQNAQNHSWGHCASFCACCGQESHHDEATDYSRWYVLPSPPFPSSRLPLDLRAAVARFLVAVAHAPPLPSSRCSGSSASPLCPVRAAPDLTPNRSSDAACLSLRHD